MLHVIQLFNSLLQGQINRELQSDDYTYEGNLGFDVTL